MDTIIRQICSILRQEHGFFGGVISGEHILDYLWING